MPFFGPVLSLAVILLLYTRDRQAKQEKQRKAAEAKKEAGQTILKVVMPQPGD